ncbi:hypothetical protein Dimus_016175, partial [Dionaea muscipula]
RRDSDAWCWKTILKARDLLVPFVNFAADGQCKFVRLQQYSMKQGYKALQAAGGKPPWV